jgi:hypothetical protein
MIHTCAGGKVTALAGKTGRCELYKGSIDVCNDCGLKFPDIVGFKQKESLMHQNVNSLIGNPMLATDGEMGKVGEFYFDTLWNSIRMSPRLWH